MFRLIRANITDCEEIHALQVKSFQALLDKYNDISTNPAAESVERIIQRMNQSFTDYYFIQLEGINIGAIRIVRLDNNSCRISPMFIAPEYQGKGYAQKTIAEVETLYPQTNGWELDTIKEETKLCHLYEKMGYKRTGKEESLQDNMTIVYYAK
ncbi:GNAT family N-acetyltransferase [Sporosarcina sp. Te-1]|uniref:GNAT family N-acetyltransferase n=1 Tax=Sporosarcina sp. Te-1 TaxID=2818390 RepID=UPI001A9F92CA|nr:GNAT family N-acetyltransferase [Sporosarcina sp. Te-1]QTD39702.1 GNAT family N-acetyltransferase [Sporosarcina sp. Te-1]